MTHSYDDVLCCMPAMGGCKAWLKLLFLLSSVVGLCAVEPDAVELWYVRSECATSSSSLVSSSEVPSLSGASCLVGWPAAVDDRLCSFVGMVLGCVRSCLAGEPVW